MNEFEFLTVMKVFGIEDKIDMDDYSLESIYLYEGLIIYFLNSSYVTIRGSISLNFVRLLNDKYSQFRNKLGIRWNELDGEAEGKETCDQCTIVKKEGLAVFLAEYKDYLAREHNMPEKEVANLKTRMVEIVEQFMYFIEPKKIKAENWMSEYGKNNAAYFYSSFKNTIMGAILNRLLRELHFAINPYENITNEMCEVGDYIDEVDVSAYYSHIRGRSGGGTLKFIDRKTGSYLSRDLYQGGFHYSVCQNLGDKSFFNFSHYVIPGREIIDVTMKDENSEIVRKIVFDVSEGTINGEFNHSPSIVEFNELCELITKATSYAALISVDKMSKKGFQINLDKKEE